MPYSFLSVILVEPVDRCCAVASKDTGKRYLSRQSSMRTFHARPLEFSPIADQQAAQSGQGIGHRLTASTKLPKMRASWMVRKKQRLPLLEFHGTGLSFLLFDSAAGAGNQTNKDSSPVTSV